MRLKQDQIDRSNLAIRELSALHKTELAKLDRLQSRVRARRQRQQRIENLRRAINEQKARLASSDISVTAANSGGIFVGSADAPLAIDANMLPSPSHQHMASQSQQAYVNSLPDGSALRARLAAYSVVNGNLKARSAELNQRNGDLEARYRKVVALCTGVPEERVEDCLGGLVQAVESEGAVEMTRVREFLRKVDGVVGG